MNKFGLEDETGRIVEKFRTKTVALSNKGYYERQYSRKLKLVELQDEKENND
jgi:hypothetical protein